MSILAITGRLQARSESPSLRAFAATLRVVCIFLAAFIIPAQAFAWGEAGHKIICEIAFRELDANARGEVEKLIRADPGYRLFSDSCNWADAIRSEDRYKRYGRLHYVNAARGAASMPTNCPGGCVISAIRDEARVLRTSASQARRLEALKFLGHFVGDVHQPLHAGYADDRGGNEVTALFYDEPQRLHRIWDTLLIRQRTRDWRKLARQLADSIESGDRTLWASPSPVSWANESRRIVELKVYDFAPGEDLARDYYRRNVRAVEQRLTAAGVRLGALLNRVYGAPGVELFE